MHNELKKGRLIVVSNRLPVTLMKTAKSSYELVPAAGGLVTAMIPVLKRSGGVWIGWAGNYAEEGVDARSLLCEESEPLAYELAPVELCVRNYELYYKGFSNEVLWPLFHNLSIYCNFVPAYYEAFKAVNEKFALAVVDRVAEDDFVWIHDYHLINVGRCLREKNIKNNMGFFLHIPFPPAETFRRMPWRREIINAMLSYDLVGFQTDGDKENFLDAVKVLGSEVVIEEQSEGVYVIETKEQHCSVGTFPISIDFDEFSIPAGEEGVMRMMQEIKGEYAGQKLMLGVDRLDYSKGIPHKLKAYRRLLELSPRLRKKVKLMQIMIPSREDIAKYDNLKSEIEQIIGEINGRFSQPGWIPIQYCYCSLSREELLAYYRASDVALVTPLKDGMNLVAKEYCTANIDNSGVLLLSEFAGAASALKEGALTVNPFDVDSMVSTMEKALYMCEDEMQERMKKLRDKIKARDIYWWVDAFLKVAKA